MTNCSNDFCLVILLFFVINTCKTDDLATNDLEYHVDSGFDDEVDILAAKLDQKVCELPFDEGDCKDRSLNTDEDIENSINNSNELLELKKLEDLKELNELNELGGSDEGGESNTRYFGFNSITRQCEQFNYDGCGGLGMRRFFAENYDTFSPPTYTECDASPAPSYKCFCRF